MTRADTPNKTIALVINPVFGNDCVLVGVPEAEAVTVADGVLIVVVMVGFWYARMISVGDGVREIDGVGELLGVTVGVN